MPPFGINARVEGQCQPDIMPELPQRLRECANHVGRAAGLDIGNGLGGDDQHAQRLPSERRLDIQWRDSGLFLILQGVNAIGRGWRERRWLGKVRE
jgi:hypothetical protein